MTKIANLYITLGTNGGIWTGKPNTVTNTGTLYKEVSGTTEVLYSSTSNGPGNLTRNSYTATNSLGTAGSNIFQHRYKYSITNGVTTVIEGEAGIFTSVAKGWLVSGTGISGGVSMAPITNKSVSESTSSSGATTYFTKDISLTVSSTYASFSALGEYNFYPNYQVVVAGAGGSILLSNRYGLNTGTWSTVYSAGTPLYGSAYGNGRWVVVGEGNKVVTSSDGYTWTARSGSQRAANWNWVAYGNGTFVAVGGAIINGQEIGTVMFSTDNGATWTTGNSGTKNTLSSVAYSPELNKFVAVGANGAIVTVNG
jgi:hypothetical protein